MDKDEINNFTVFYFTDRAHPHSLSANDDKRKTGVVMLEFDDYVANTPIELKNFVIECGKKMEIKSRLETREAYRIDPFKRKCIHATICNSLIEFWLLVVYRRIWT